MQKVNKSPGSLIPGILIPLFFLFLLTSCRQEISPISEENIIALQLWLDENQTSPGELISEELSQGRSLILTQDNHLRADTIDLVKTLVPGLYDQGIREIGLFFLDTGKQRELDELVLEGKEKNLAEKILFSADAAMGYIEYCDFIIYIRDFNLTLDENETAIRLLALGKNGKVSTDLLSEALGNPEQDNSDDVELKLPVFLWISSEDV
ncbi:MAG: hypothetical protein KAH21_12790, partial [Spirochaetaceae bacterium]|nr:hypothetical protein [Spirochaetaceae bacterium]